MMKKTIAALVLISLSALTTWGIGTDNSCCIGQGDGCLPPACGSIGCCLCSQICGGMTVTWSTHNCQTTTTTTATSTTMDMHCTSTSHSISTGPRVWVCTQMFMVGCPGLCHGPVVTPPCHVPCVAGCD